MDLWNEICFLINEHLRRGSAERDFQIEAENLFEKLGWSRYKGEIVSQEIIPIGSAQSLRPDIIVKNEGKNAFVVELKKPGAGISGFNAQQLASYMLQLKLRFGLLIGDSIQLWYDDSADQEHPELIVNVGFSPDNDEGQRLIAVFSKEHYSEAAATDYCQQIIVAKKNRDKADAIVRRLVRGEDSVGATKLLASELREQYGDDLARIVMDNVKVVVARKEVAPSVQASCKEDAVSAHSLQRPPALPAQIPLDGSNEPYLDEPIEFNGRQVETCKKSTESFQDFVKRTLDSFFTNNMIPLEELALVQTKDYSKRTFGIEYPLLEADTNKLRDSGGQARYWTRTAPFAGKYYACSQWWKQKMGLYEPLFSQWIKHIVELNNANKVEGSRQ